MADVKVYSDENMLQDALNQATSFTKVLNKNGLFTVVGEGLPDLRPTYTPPAPGAWWLGGGKVPSSDTYTIYDPILSNNLTESYVNLANPGTRNATPGVAPDFTSEGWLFNGTTHWLDTQTVPEDDQTILIWLEEWSNVYVIGSFDNTAGVSQLYIRPVFGGDIGWFKGDQKLFGSQQRGGILGLSDQPNASGQNLLTPFISIPGTNRINMYLGCINQNGTPGSFGSGTISRLAIYDFVLTEEQIEAVSIAMFEYDGNQDHPYKNTVLAQNPRAYYTCNQTYGSALFDISGQKAHQAIGNADGGFTAGFPGLRGNAIGGTDIPLNSFYRSFEGWNTKAVINFNSFSISMWFKVTRDPADQVRLVTVSINGQTEYYYVEFRNGIDLDIFHREGAVTENSVALHKIVDDEWHHMVAFNNSAIQESGIYLDKVLQTYSKTSTGLTGPTVVDDGSPASFFDVKGFIQHMAWFDRVLDQTEVNALFDSQNPGFSDEARDVFDRLPGITASEKTAVAAYVDSQVSAGNWGTKASNYTDAKVEAFWCFKLGTEGRALQQWHPVSNVRIGLNVGGVKVSEGFQFNGTNQYLNTQFIPANANIFQLDDAFFSVYTKVTAPISTDNHVPAGTWDGSTGFCQLSNQVSGNANFGVNSVPQVSDIAGNSGNDTLKTLSRNSSTQMEHYLNGVSQGTIARSSSALSDEAFYIAARNDNGVPNLFFEGTISSFSVGASSGYNELSAYNDLVTLLNALP